jgi:hypothetical protein
VKLLVRVVTSVLGAGVLYGAWLALDLSIAPTPTPGVSPAPDWFFLSAPIATALGFALGAQIGDRLVRGPRPRFGQTYLWAVAGCVVGALVVYPFGPMLICFGMFGLGTVAVIAEAVVLKRRARRLAG